MRNDVRALLVGVVAGLASGLLGIGGGLVMVPLLVTLLSLSQHQAHATSLAATVLIAGAGGIAFGTAGEVDLAVAFFLAVGTLIGAPIGAKLMSQASEAKLKIALGVFMVLVGAVLVMT